MNVLAYALIAFMLAAYVMLDGFDLGVATISPLVAKTDRERAAGMASIGPFWNGNEVWLIAAGGALFALFPLAYAVSFSGFYLPFMVVLWLLMFRGIAIELRGHLSSELWHSFWDSAFTLSSALLIFLFGIALGNLLRGVPLGANGYFQGTFSYLLNPYALLIGVFSLLVLGLHGAAWLGMRVEGPVAERAAKVVIRGWWTVLIAYIIVTAVTLLIRGLPTQAVWLFAMPVASLAALVGVALYARAKRTALAFACSSAFILTLFVEVAGSLFPYLLPGYPTGHGGISIYAAAPSPIALISAFIATGIGVVAVLTYATVVFRRMMTKVSS